MTALPGVDFDALTRWLDSEQPGLRRGELSGEVIAGGKSNLTYRLTDGSSTWALRRPPLAHVLPTAHDMAREFRVISALAGTHVPVAHAIASCADPAVLGAPFYLMEFIDGVVLDRPAVLAGVDAATAQAVSDRLVDTLVELHAVDPAAVGLADFGRPDGFLARQLARWHKQWDASATRPSDQLESVVGALTAALPAPSAPSAPAIVHGDYRLTNVMYRRDLSAIAAVVDWEMATLGDPLTDVGLLVVYQSLAVGENVVGPRLDPAAGWPSADDLARRYGARSGRALDTLAWYVGFGFFKLAVVAEGIHHRYLAGKTVGEGFDHFGAAVPTLLDSAAVALAGR